MKVDILMIKWVDMENKYFQTLEFMKENLKIIRGTEKVFLNIKMVQYMKDTFKIVKKMEKVF